MLCVLAQKVSVHMSNRMYHLTNHEMNVHENSCAILHWEAEGLFHFGPYRSTVGLQMYSIHVAQQEDHQISLKLLVLLAHQI